MISLYIARIWAYIYLIWQLFWGSWTVTSCLLRSPNFIFACKKIEYLEHLISKDRVKYDIRKLESMISWPNPKNLKSLWCYFFGLIDFYGNFIKNWSNINSIDCLIKKGENFLLPIYKRELLPLVIVIKEWRPYLLRSTFIVRTDHHNLKYLLWQKIGIAAQQKWISKLLGNEFTIENKKSADNKVANAMSIRVNLEGAMILGTITFPNPTWLKN